MQMSKAGCSYWIGEWCLPTFAGETCRPLMCGMKFSCSDQVVLWVPRSGKLELGAQGPFCFIQYTCQLGVMAII